MPDGRKLATLAEAMAWLAKEIPKSEHKMEKVQNAAVTPKYFAPVDPAARWTAANGGLAFFAYATNYLIDLDHAVIVEVEASSAVRQAEVTAAKTMIMRAHDRFDLHPERLAADTGYGSAEMLDWLVNQQDIEPHVHVFDNPNAPTGPSPGTTSPTTKNATSMSVRVANT